MEHPSAWAKVASRRVILWWVIAAGVMITSEAPSLPRLFRRTMIMWRFCGDGNPVEGVGSGWNEVPYVPLTCGDWSCAGQRRGFATLTR